MEVEDEVKLANIAEIFVQHFYERMNEFKDDQLIIVLVHNGDEIKTGVSLVEYLVLFVVDEIAHFGLTSDDQLIYLHRSNKYLFKKSLLLLL